ncbi:MAG: translation initiation factor IF-2 [Acidimicrobiaceae bacterium]|nr:translation initiation factor IF-2 [Acidimicrobiaceae bacterium]
MGRKIRVYELAKELDLSNKEALDLCIALGIGVKSHSSSIEDAQADRARRKAIRDGIGHRSSEAVPSEVNNVEKSNGSEQASSGERPKAAIVTEVEQPKVISTTTKQSQADKEGEASPSTKEATPSTVNEQEGSKAQSSHAVRSTPSSHSRATHPRTDVADRTSAVAKSAGETVQSVVAPAEVASSSPAAANLVKDEAPPEVESRVHGDLAKEIAEEQRRILESENRSVPSSTRPKEHHNEHGPDDAHKPAAAQSHGATARHQSAPAGKPATGGQDRAARGPSSLSGKPIPPPPGGPPRSLSGKPIPPPPRAVPGQRTTGGGQGGDRSFSGPRPGGFSGPRPGGFSGPRPGGGGTGGGGQGGDRSFSGPRPGAQDRPAAADRGARPGGFSGPRPGGFSGPRPGGAPGAGTDRPPRSGGFSGPRPGGASSGGFASRGPASASAPSTKGGPPSRGRPTQRQSKRRSKKNFEELEPTQVTAYTPSNAPVPDHEIIVERGSTAQEFAPKLNRSAGDVVKFLLLQGELVTATQSLSDDMIDLFAVEIGAQVRLVDPGQEQEAELEAKYFDDDETEEKDSLTYRAPVITVMGHVDHGKTKLLDRIRETNVVASEAGGITQHIGAYKVNVSGRSITFIDTPGHEAFTQMRARGAKVTDIVVLVVAADDGVMPQTVEAINHAKAAEVPIIVAINKIDRENADPKRVMQQLSEYGLVPEQWGGDTITVELSALQNLGVDDLLEQILVLSEVLELKANLTGRARGVVLEGNLDVGRGPVATMLVQKGVLKVGDQIVAGQAWGRVKAMIDQSGRAVKEALPSTPVQVLGFSEVPAAGDDFRVTQDQSTAKMIAESREQRYRMAGYTTRAAAAAGAKLEDLFEQIQKGEAAALNLIVKADVQGSLEALAESLRKLERPEVKLSIIHKAVGGINENDVGLAAASNATIIGFNVRPDRRSRELAESQDVEIRTYEIIYKVLEDIEAAMVGMLAPEFEEVITGDAEVREIFRVPRAGMVAGCYVTNGSITRGSKVRFIRDGVVIWKGSINTLRRFKDDVREVQTGFECGIGLSDFQDLRQGDIIETFEDREIPRS